MLPAVVGLAATSVALATLVAPPASAAQTCVVTASGAGWSVTLCLSVAGAGTSVTGPVAVSASATTDGAGAPRVAKVEFALRGGHLLTDFEAPYTFTLQTADFVDGPAALTASAVLRDGSVSDPTSLPLTLVNGVSVPPPSTGTFSHPTAPPATQTAPVVVAATGDGAGGETAATNVTDMMAAWQPKIVNYLGDVYEKGTLTEFKNWFGDAVTWFGRFRSITAPVVGNHEYNKNAAGGYDAEGYFSYWGNVPHYYSFDAGGWHFIALDSTTQYGQTDATSDQYRWLAGDLATRANPCTIVTWHHPLNTIGSEAPSPRMAAIWSLLRQNNVTLVLNGHDHQYQRWTPLDADQQPDPAGVTQIVAGSGGHSSQGFQSSDPRVVAKAQAYGALRLELRPDRVDYTFRTPDGGTGRVLDSGFVGCRALSPDTGAPTVPTGLTATVNPSTTATHTARLSWSAAADNRGVAQYKVFSDGVLLATLPGSTTLYTTPGIPASTTRSFQVSALDAAGNESALSTPVTVLTPPATPVTVTSTATADAYTSASLPTKNYGTASTLRLDADPAQTSYLRFTVADSYPNVRRALLKVWSNGKSSSGLQVRSVGSTTWSETGISYATAPASGALVGTSGAVAAGSWVTADVTSAVTGNGPVSFVLSTTSATAFTLNSREAGAATSPQLVVDSEPPPDTTAPSVPAGLHATVAGESRVDLAWSASTDVVGVAGYTVYRDGVALDTVPGTTTTYSDPTVGAGRTFGYTVDAFDDAGNHSAPSAAAIATTPDETPPEPPDPFDAFATSTSTVHLTWGASTDNVAVTGYRLRRDGLVIATLPPSSTDYLDTGRSAGATYTYTLQASDAAGNGSDPATSTLTMPPNQGGNPPTAPTGVQAMATGENSVALEWLPSLADTAISAYQVFRNAVSVGFVNGSTTTWTDGGLQPNVSYTYTVRALDQAANASALSAPVTATTWPVDVIAPTVPTGLAGTGVSTTSIALSWDASTDARGVASYRVYRDGSAVADVPATSTQWTDGGLAVGSTHAYQVDAVDVAANRSARSVSVNTQTAVPPPSTQAFSVDADAYVSAASPTSKYGTATSLRLDGDPVVSSYLRFTVSGAQPRVTSAVLKIYGNGKSVGGFDVRGAASSWAEGTLTYANAPTPGATTLAQAGPTTGAGWVSVPVTATITGNGQYTFVLSQTNATAVAYQSKEAGSATAAVLEVTSSY